MRRTARLAALPLMALVAACSNPQRSSAEPPLPGPDAPLAAPNRAPPADFTTMKMSFAPIVRRAAPAVVNVYSTRTVRTQVDPFWALFGGMSVPRERVEGSLGSGVVVRADGVIVTNNHVIEGGQSLRVVLADRREFPAKVLLADARSDIAVLKIDTKGERLPVLPIDGRNDVQVGDLVLAIGDPFGVGQTVTNGIVSGLARTDVGATDSGFYLQTDAAINPGNSGGPLVDMAGNLIGLNTFILSRSGSSSGVGFAIPGALVKRVVESAVGGAKAAPRPGFGAKVTAGPAAVASSLGRGAPEGVLVAEIYPDGPAERAGLQVGDLVLAIDGQAVNDQAALNYLISTHRPGDRVAVSYVRHGATRTATLVVNTPVANPAPDQRTLTARSPLQGATVVNLSPAADDQYGLDLSARGVLVSDVGQGIAAQTGFQAGDVIRAVNGVAVTSTAQLAGLLATPVGGWRVTIQRGDQQITAQF
jgi:Do/DeqQ family serine protease